MKLRFQMSLKDNKLENASDEVREKVAFVVEQIIGLIEEDAKGYIIEKDIIDTGAMLASVQSEMISEFTGDVFVGQEYGIYHEFGTEHMAARPFLGPAVDDNWPIFQDAMAEAIKEVFE